MHAEECCEREGFEANYIFAIKSLLKEKPYQMLLVNFAISLISFGFSVRSFERYFLHSLNLIERFMKILIIRIFHQVLPNTKTIHMFGIVFGL